MGLIRMRFLAPTVLVLLASCVPASQPYYPAAPQAQAYYPAPTPQPQRANARGGSVTNYAGNGDGSRITVKLTSLGNGLVRAEGATTGVGGGFCAGSFSGNGTFRGQSLAIKDETVPDCTFTLTRSGRRLTLDEAPQCLTSHGPSCGFGGTLAQR